jgi:hypothetical protein
MPHVGFLVVAAMLTLGPMTAVLQVHHLLGEADQDGHQHSESDLCQWVLHHVTSTVMDGALPLEVCGSVDHLAVFQPPVPGYPDVLSNSAPRAPPVLS